MEYQGQFANIKCVTLQHFLTSFDVKLRAGLNESCSEANIWYKYFPLA